MTAKPSANLLISALAIAGGAAIFALVLLYPWTVALSGPILRKVLFALMVISAGLGFVYGLGFRAGNGIISKLLLSPVMVLLLLAVSLAWIGYALSIGPAGLQGG